MGKIYPGKMSQFRNELGKMPALGMRSSVSVRQDRSESAVRSTPTAGISGGNAKFKKNSKKIKIFHKLARFLLYNKRKIKRKKGVCYGSCTRYRIGTLS